MECGLYEGIKKTSAYKNELSRISNPIIIKSMRGSTPDMDRYGCPARVRHMAMRKLMWAITRKNPMVNAMIREALPRTSAEKSK